MIGGPALPHRQVNKIYKTKRARKTGERVPENKKGVHKTTNAGKQKNWSQKPKQVVVHKRTNTREQENTYYSTKGRLCREEQVLENEITGTRKQSKKTNARRQENTGTTKENGGRVGKNRCYKIMQVLQKEDIITLENRWC